MPSASFTILSFSLHWYGILLALAMVLVYLISEKRVLRIGLAADLFAKVAVISLILGLLGARFWHVITAWKIYVGQPIAVLYVWRGGMSIFGGLVGGSLGVWWSWRRWLKSRLSFFQLSDSIVFALPFGQAIGRLGNWVNQELYGLPTNLPWKIFITKEHRLPGFEQFSYYHPLFAYEALALLLFATLLWKLEQRYSQAWRVGSGNATISYILFYSGLRFLLDFFRPDKEMFFSTGLGTNQVVMVFVFVAFSFLMRNKISKPTT